MNRMPNLQKSAKVAVAAALLAATGSLALSAPASADPWDHGWHERHEWHGGWGPRVWAVPAPVYVPAPGPRCWIQRRWVPGPWGWHWAPRRVFRW